MRLTLTMIAAALVGACNQQAAQNQQVTNTPEAAAQNQTAVNPPEAAAPNEPAQAPSANAALAKSERTALIEPKGPIDPKSAEAAGQIVQSFGALIEQKRFAEAAKLWGDPATAAQFTSRLKRNSETHLEIGELGPLE